MLGNQAECEIGSVVGWSWLWEETCYLVRKVNNVREPAIKTLEDKTFQTGGAANSKVPSRKVLCVP